MPKYIKKTSITNEDGSISTIPHTFNHRLAMCEAFKEGTEIEDIVKTLTVAARMLHAFEDFFCETVLMVAEQLCLDYIKNTIWSCQCDWETYDECDPEVYAHFTGGARKLSKEKYNERR